jgi:translation initiation factor 1|tara:strand:+ start:260 stop:571 length:312 start_codon:yes stop_codon:yes gene_type:complete
MKNQTRLVYSTEKGQIKSQESKKIRQYGDGVARINYETKGRKGNGVTTISGLYTEDIDLKTLIKKLKKNCGSGGTIKNNIVEIQGDHRIKIRIYLEQEGHSVL